jgi:hypothetical protein
MRSDACDWVPTLPAKAATQVALKQPLARLQAQTQSGRSWPSKHAGAQHATDGTTSADTQDCAAAGQVVQTPTH